MARSFFLSRVILAILGLALAVGVVFGLLYLRLVGGYQVRGVPYFGMTSTAGPEQLYADTSQDTQPQSRGSAGASLLTVGGYWRLQDPSQPLLLPNKVREKIPVGAPGTLTDIALAAKESGYKVKIGRAYFGIWSLSSYTNAKKPTPIIVEQTFSKDFPQETQNYYRIVLGVSPGAKEVYVHDYAYGPVQTMSRQAFVALWKKPRRLLIIEPPDRRAADRATPQLEYPSRVLTPQERELSTHWYLGEITRFARDTEKATDYYEKVIRSQAFSSQPPGHRLYQVVAQLFLYLDQKRHSDIVALEPVVGDIIREVKVNWIGRDPAQEKAMAWSLIGEGYLGVGDTAKARSYAERAMAEVPNFYGGQQLLKKIQ